ncbi:PREDICTED: uncharacterized protein LOC108765802 [Trachymyrmex cornetzi]|uniref:uncharacterized protein LOC108765802 n=1 Tax=Trachymyrmex cornetzi TaxID=471704 RepID=UPI00084F661F|nr:PREDICTED: uncharacterized protein LOC108765802 [Trachymyrmex cornetzi]
MYESDWEQYKCKVKKDNIVGIDEAELWEEDLPIKRHKPNKSIQRPIPSQTSIDKLFQDLNPTSTIPEIHIQEEPEKLAINENNTIHDTNNFLLPVEYDSANVTTIDVSSLNLPLHSQDDLVLKEILQIILDVQASQTRMEEHQKLFAEKMNVAVLKLSLTTDKVYTMLKGIQDSSLADSSMHINPNSSITEPLNLFAQKFIFPLNTVSDIDTYKTIGETEGNEEGKNVAKNIVAIFFFEIRSDSLLLD